MIIGNSKTALQKIITVCEAVAEGDFESRILDIHETGILGDLMHTINLMIDRTDAYMRESKATLEYVSRNQYFRTIAEKGMAGSFLESARTINRAVDFVNEKNESFLKMGGSCETKMNEVVESITQSVEDLEMAQNLLDDASKSASEQSISVAAGAEQASANMTGVASASEELTGSIDEISRQVVRATDITEMAVAKAGNMQEHISSLTEVSSKIANVVELITEIAGQTNLLALNATIESARAGDAGKGFAVVASEVKTLAAQTETATAEIKTRIEDIQNATEEAVSANKEIDEAIAQVNEISTAIAAAVEEQGAATREISRNVQEAATGTTEVSSSINQVKKTTEEVRRTSGQVESASSVLKGQGSELKAMQHQMCEFLSRAAKAG